MESVYVARERGAGPGVAAEVEGVLVALGFIFVLEAVLAVCAFVLLLGLVGAGNELVHNMTENKGFGTYASASSVSNFLGFLGQQSHTYPLWTFRMPFFGWLMVSRVLCAETIGLESGIALWGSLGCSRGALVAASDIEKGESWPSIVRGETAPG